MSTGYANSVKLLSKAWVPVMLAFAGLIALTVLLFEEVPTGFVPAEDQGYVMLVAQLPDAATIERTEAVMGQASELAESTPGVADVLAVAGYNVIDAIMKSLQAQVSQIPGARILVVNAPSIPGLGSTGGFTFEMQDLDGQGVEALSKASSNFIEQAHQRPELAGVYTTFNAEVPQRFLDVDRTKAKTRGVSITDIFDTLQINLGSLYVNEFNKWGRVYRVYVQAEQDARATEEDIGRLRVRNQDGEMIELNAFVDSKPMVGPYNITHYNMYKSVAVNGSNAPGYSSGQAIEVMEELAETALPDGFGFEWTGLTYQQLKAGNVAPLAFGLSLVFVFLVLAALYESWLMPFMILLTIPLGLLGAVGALMLMGLDLDVYGQIGLVMLIGLVAKNAILIVEFAKELRDKGHSIMESAMTAARLRLRPILMTALAFIIGLMPLVVATGAGAGSRRSLGTAVVGGLAFATIMIVFVPVIYVLLEKLREGKSGRESGDSDAGDKPAGKAGSEPEPQDA